MATPVLKVNGQEIELQRPNMKMWRLVAEYDDKDKSGWRLAELMEGHAAMLAKMYAVNADDIDPADVLPGYVEAATYIINTANERLKNLPKAEAEGEE